jgi:hypothetical protein
MSVPRGTLETRLLAPKGRSLPSNSGSCLCPSAISCRVIGAPGLRGSLLRLCREVRDCSSRNNFLTSGNTEPARRPETKDPRSIRSTARDGSQKSRPILPSGQRKRSSHPRFRRACRFRGKSAGLTRLFLAEQFRCSGRVRSSDHGCNSSGTGTLQVPEREMFLEEHFLRAAIRRVSSVGVLTQIPDCSAVPAHPNRPQVPLVPTGNPNEFANCSSRNNLVGAALGYGDCDQTVPNSKDAVLNVHPSPPLASFRKLPRRLTFRDQLPPLPPIPALHRTSPSPSKLSLIPP